MQLVLNIVKTSLLATYRPLFLYARNIKTYTNFGRARALGYTKTYQLLKKIDATRLRITR
jgi:hypothetical protein